MTIQTTATIQGHPWDLWGLARLFDGSDASHTRVETEEPKGRPTFDTNDPAAVMRFRAHGYDVFAAVTSDELVWDEAKGPVDLRDIAPIAEDFLARVNGLGILFDPQFKAARILYLGHGSGESAGSLVHTDWTPNRDATPLGEQPEHAPFARNALSLAQTNSTVRLVLDAIALPRTWASMYLIYEAIAESVGGVHKLDTLNFVTDSDLKNFRNAANNNRSLTEGMRHAKKPQPGTFIPFDQAYFIINTLCSASWTIGCRVGSFEISSHSARLASSAGGGMRCNRCMRSQIGPSPSELSNLAPGRPSTSCWCRTNCDPSASLCCASRVGTCSSSFTKAST